MSTFRIRSVRVQDAEALLRINQALADEGVGMVVENEDLPQTLADQASLLQSRIADAFAHTLVGLLRDGDEEVLIGFAEWNRLRPAKLRHNVELAMGVRPGYQGRGYGRLLLERLLQDARATEPAVTRVELCVIADNTHARSLYDALGFRVEGVRRGFVCDAQGERDDCLMALRL